MKRIKKSDLIKEELLYNWLKDNKSYIKRGKANLYFNNPFKANYNSVENALKRTRTEFKDYYKQVGDKVPKQPKVVLKALKMINKIKNEVITVPSIVKYKIPSRLDPNNILVIADQHEPFCKKGYLEHCIAMRNKYNCGTIVLIGDEVDLCGVSQWEKDPDGFSAGTEAELAQTKMKAWYAAFPSAFVCIGNHTARPFRQAKANGIPKKFIKSYEEAWEAPKTWKWAENWEINGILFTHGTGHSGPNAAIKIATRHRQNTVIGHIHSEAGIQYSASKIDLVWGMQVGGALDDSSYAAYYAKDQLKKSIVGCGVILGNTPIYEPMIL